MAAKTQDELEERIGQFIAQLEKEVADEPSWRWMIVRGLIHRAVHYAVERKVEFCGVASYLGEMVAHAHKLAHGDNPKAPAHKDFVH